MQKPPDSIRKTNRPSRANPSLLNLYLYSFIARHFQIIEKYFKWSVRIYSGTPLPVRNRIYFLDQPCGRLGLAHCPRFAASANLAVGQVLDLKFQVIPRVSLPCEWHGHRASGFGLPGLQFQSLVVAEKHKRVSLSYDARIAHLPSL